ncbi:MAG: restriction endonuclease subunit S, partial [Rikenellaceae bacterium]|jgi:type I restriction enzyme S subunit|nr:restriction endonuclease subunit S [Rikenellaceae bacterium]
MKCNSQLYRQNTVFITARGTVGKIVMAGCDMAMNQTNYALIGKDRCGQLLTYHITKDVVERLKKKANGAVFDAITTRDFEAEEIIIPSSEQMCDFENMVSPIYDNILNSCVQNRRLANLRDTLLPKLMSGELSVEEAEQRL